MEPRAAPDLNRKQWEALPQRLGAMFNTCSEMPRAWIK
jgi:hypothetical protein